MIKRLFYTALTLLFLCGNVQAQTPEELRATVSYLASDELRGRATGSAGIVKAQGYIAKELRETGIEPHFQAVPSLVCRNVVAWIEGTSNEYIVIGAHLDHVGTNRRRQIVNGADDNASGSAAILALAKRLSKIKPYRSIVFVWFTGEEYGLVGSRYYVANPLSPHSDSLPVFMLNLDMVGHLTAEASREAGAPPLKPDEVLDPLFEEYPFAERITLRGGDAASDQIPFYQKKIPCVFLHTGMHRRYHQPSDDTDTLDFPGMVAVCNYAYDLILAISGEARDYNIMGL